MILVAVELEVEPGSADKVKDAIAKMEAATREEEGCITYAFSVDVNDPGKLRVLERWRSVADIQSHMASPHMAEFGMAVAQVQPKSMQVKAYETTEIELPR